MLQPPEKRPRKSVGDKRVSFGAVSVHLIEKVEASPVSATRRRSSAGGSRRPSISSVPETDGLPEAVDGHCQLPDSGLVADSENQPPIQPPPPPPVIHSPQKERVDQRLSLPPQSPVPSEASDLFFSPSESVTGHSPARTPSLRGLLNDDEAEEARAPAFSRLLEEDEEDLNGNQSEEVDMDMTMTLDADSLPLAVSVPRPVVAGKNSCDAQDPIIEQAYLECSTGGATELAAPAVAQVGTATSPDVAVAVPMPVLARPLMELVPAHISSPVPAPPSSVSETWHESETDEILAAKRDSVPKELRRYSFSQKLAAVSSRLFRYASAEKLVESAARVASIEAESELDICEKKGSPRAAATASIEFSRVEETLAIVPVASFDNYLKEAGVIFLDENSGRRHTSLGPNKTLAGLLAPEGTGAGEALANRLMGACVLQPELEQLDWAAKELSKCIAMLNDGYLKMEEYVVQNASTFFSAPETKVPAAHLKKLRNRCRQTARIFWYDWRATLESDLSNKLQRAEQCFDADLARLQEHNSRLLQLQAQLDAATPTPINECQISMNSVELSELEANTVVCEAVLARMGKHRAVLQEQVRLAQSALVTAHEGHAVQQQWLSQLEKKMQERAKPVSRKDSFELQGKELLDALQAAVCWRPVELSSSCVMLRYGNHFELVTDFAADATKGRTVISVQLRSMLPLQLRNLAEPRPELQLLNTCFDLIQADMCTKLAACRSLAQLRTLLQKLSLRLGRLLELADEVQELAARRLLCIERNPYGDGVNVTMRLSYAQICVRFTLKLMLLSEQPDAPMQWHLSDWQQHQDKPSAIRGSADSLRESVGIICKEYCCGLNRLRGIDHALDVAFYTTELKLL